MNIDTSGATRHREMAVEAANLRCVRALPDMYPGYRDSEIQNLWPARSTASDILVDSPGSLSAIRASCRAELTESISRLRIGLKRDLANARELAYNSSFRTVVLRRKTIVLDRLGRKRSRYVRTTVRRFEKQLFRKLRKQYSEPILGRFRDAIRDAVLQYRRSVLRRESLVKQELRPMIRSRNGGTFQVHHSDEPVILFASTEPPHSDTVDHYAHLLTTYQYDHGAVRPASCVFRLPVGDGGRFALPVQHLWWSYLDPGGSTGPRIFQLTPFSPAASMAEPYSDLHWDRTPYTMEPVPEDDPYAWSWYRPGSARVEGHVDEREIESVLLAQMSALDALHLSDRDMTFVLARSIGELKDLPQTIKDGFRFIRGLADVAKSLRRGKVIGALAGLTLRSSMREIAGAWLGWKFAIKPTIDDIKHILDCGLQAASLVRTALASIQSELGNQDLMILTRRFPILRPPRVGTTRPGALSRFRDGTLRIDLGYSRASYASSSSSITINGAPRLYSQRAGNLANESWARNYLTGNPCGVGSIETNSQNRIRFDIYPIDLLDPNVVDPSYRNLQSRVREAFFNVMTPTLADEFPIHLPQALSGAVMAKFDTSTILAAMTNDLRTIGGLLDASQAIYTAWELLPLSFVMDWFATTHRTILALSNWCSKWNRGIERYGDPMALLRAGLHTYDPTISGSLTTLSSGSSSRATVSSDTFSLELRNERRSPATLGPLPGFSPGWVRAPRPVPVGEVQLWWNFRLRHTVAYRNLHPTGITRVVRGWYTSDISDIMSILPRVRLNLSADKILTLFAMFGL